MSRPRPYAGSVAVPLPDEEEIRRVAGDGYDPDSALNVVKMFAGTGDLYPALIGMVHAVFGADDIDARHREVIILRAAAVLDVIYEWQANERMAQNAGLPQDEIESLASGDVAGLDPEHRLLAVATEQLLTTATLQDVTLQELLDRFGATTTRRYVATIAWFSLLSLFLNGTRVPLETTDKIGDRTSPLG